MALCYWALLRAMAVACCCKGKCLLSQLDRSILIDCKALGSIVSVGLIFQSYAADRIKPVMKAGSHLKASGKSYDRLHWEGCILHRWGLWTPSCKRRRARAMPAQM